jgi:hypothetical protein
MKAKLFNYVITLIIVGLAVWAAVLSIVGIAPRVRLGRRVRSPLLDL